VCTVSLVGFPDGGYLLAANRDEYVTRRAALPPARERAGANGFVAPRDADAGGTWIAVDREGRSLCLLNGDRPAQGLVEPARSRSRGLLVLELLDDPRPEEVAARLRDLHARARLDVRPFKLVAVAPRCDGTESGIHAVRADFDGRKLSIAALVAPHVETSNGFDPAGVASARGESFRRLSQEVSRATPERAPEAEDCADRWRDALLRWHGSHADPTPGSLFSVCVHRPEIRTVSCTLVDVRPARIALRYQPGYPCEAAPAVELSP